MMSDPDATCAFAGCFRPPEAELEPQPRPCSHRVYGEGETYRVCSGCYDDKAGLAEQASRCLICGEWSHVELRQVPRGLRGGGGQ